MPNNGFWQRLLRHVPQSRVCHRPHPWFISLSLDRKRICTGTILNIVGLSLNFTAGKESRMQKFLVAIITFDAITLLAVTADES
jgi:hypothetical protein